MIGSKVVSILLLLLGLGIGLYGFFIFSMGGSTIPVVIISTLYYIIGSIFFTGGVISGVLAHLGCYLKGSKDEVETPIKRKKESSFIPKESFEKYMN